MSERLLAVPLSLDEANAFVAQHHRHHAPVIGHKFSIGAAWDGALIGVAIVGRPVSRVRDDARTLEVTRLCTDGVKRPLGRLNRRGEPCYVNAPSFLYAWALRATFALGFVRLGTYIRADERGVSLLASGWLLIGETKGRSWNCQSRPRQDRTDIVNRNLFGVEA